MKDLRLRGYIQAEPKGQCLHSRHRQSVDNQHDVAGTSSKLLRYHEAKSLSNSLNHQAVFQRYRHISLCPDSDFVCMLHSSLSSSI